jgi:oligopeptide/dipeptide ABC transporter ATP-binding protein
VSVAHTHCDNQTSPLLSVKGLTIGFRSQGERVDVVRDIGFSIAANETVALVGESGCGKSVTALSLSRLIPSPPVCYPAGSILFRGVDTLGMSPAELRGLRGGGIGYVFQDPATALNPVLRVGFQLSECLEGNRRQRREQALSLLARVGLPSPQGCLDAYPYELSGGMQQRVVIAMAIAQQPALLVADEPTTALDVTIQAQILKLLRTLQQASGMSVLLITHNLGLVAEAACKVNVMYAGILVEGGDTEAVLTGPAHPYTRGLLNVVPRLERHVGRLSGIPGTVPVPGRLPSGCPFAPRCKRADATCRDMLPDATPIGGDTTRFVRCFHPLQAGETL